MYAMCISEPTGQNPVILHMNCFHFTGTRVVHTYRATALLPAAKLSMMISLEYDLYSAEWQGGRMYFSISLNMT